ncbi:L-rhamnose mutarotase [Cryobacterium tepidiphilum]|uniref:L-rhamnose mutarotase n=1 Tax=Cryobacterium tepidiphilum TaxID=2486026 RepID=A0A3M8LNX4_9MICO|nr:L-rhamnose mutarotase [Cryobacterium tepidiphilum]
MTSAVPHRVCFQLQVRADRLEEYRERHETVWPDMLREIEASGRRNYSLFLRDDGLLIGYFETDSLEASDAYLAASPAAARWEADMAPFFAALDGRPDQSFLQLPEIFNLHDQLASLEATNEGPSS